MTISRLLQEARMLISSPDRWCKGNYAQNLHGKPCTPGHPEAWCYCSIGAVMARANNTPILHSAIRCLNDAANINIVAFNDNPDTQHGDVLMVFDKAIDLASNMED